MLRDLGGNRVACAERFARRESRSLCGPLCVLRDLGGNRVAYAERPSCYLGGNRVAYAERFARYAI